jgi:indolepyruvate ferredoxin oxidoreductase, beta subunit
MAPPIWTGWTASSRATTPRGAGCCRSEAAKYIANAMAYDDIIRVADLKTRGRRFDRIRKEMRVKDANLCCS